VHGVQDNVDNFVIVHLWINKKIKDFVGIVLSFSLKIESSIYGI